MEAMDKRKKDRLMKGIILNALIFIGCTTYIMVSIVPQYSAMALITENTNGTIEDIGILKKDGVKNDSFIEILNRLGRKKEIADIILDDSEKLNRVLAKPPGEKKDYLSWLIEQNSISTTLNDEIQRNETILGNIIPNFADSSSFNISEDIGNKMTLASFISYIEKDILEKYELTSYAPLGVSNISFPDKKDAVINIGSFKITLDFKGKNSNILSLIDALQKSGKLIIKSGKLISGNVVETSIAKGGSLSQLSNLLVGVNALSLISIPNIPSAVNNGSITLEFYVEGMNYEKILVLRSLLTTKFNELLKSVKEKGSLCAKSWNPLCNETVTANAVASIKGLTKNIVALQSKIDTFKKGTTTIDINAEIDMLSGLRTSLDTIETIYAKNNAILDKAKKQPSTK